MPRGDRERAEDWLHRMVEGVKGDPKAQPAPQEPVPPAIASIVCLVPLPSRSFLLGFAFAALLASPAAA